jgi:hypothetical protein
MMVGNASQESGVRSQESGVRSQESGVRSQESGVRSQEAGGKSLPCDPKLSLGDGSRGGSKSKAAGAQTGEGGGTAKILDVPSRNVYENKAGEQGVRCRVRGVRAPNPVPKSRTRRHRRHRQKIYVPSRNVDEKKEDSLESALRPKAMQSREALATGAAILAPSS